MPMSIDQTFAALREKKQLAFMPFITAGYPTLDFLTKLLPALEKAGANLIEIGFPFSDPIADGPVIQESYTHALGKKIRMADVFAAIKAAMVAVNIPVVGMVSYSIIYRFGLEAFCREAIAARISGLILPDLPPPEAKAICQKINALGLKTILLVAPTTPLSRRKEIAELCTGFIYYLSLSGITGERSVLPADITQSLQQLRSVTDRPICVGFGISKPEHLQQLKPYADGAIVGSAIVRRMKQHVNESQDTIAKEVAAYCEGLLAGVR
ncbi:MAG TPA: tryptophan synthase subunit alpha [Tepidisphaeraceae bacterium]|jgi:tryptophan synthase alpha chain